MSMENLSSGEALMSVAITIFMVAVFIFIFGSLILQYIH